jgi:hypothetical protein
MYLDNRGALARSRDYNVRRQEARYVSSVPVGLQRFLRFGPFVTRGVTLDISLRGMSALVCGAPRAGETVVITLSLRDAPIEMLATVRHSSDAKSGLSSPSVFDCLTGNSGWATGTEKTRRSIVPLSTRGCGQGGQRLNRCDCKIAHSGSSGSP